MSACHLPSLHDSTSAVSFHRAWLCLCVGGGADTTAVLPTVSCPVTRQLLGSAFSNYGAYGPSAADVPLREWIDKVCGIAPAETGLDGTGQDMGAGQGLSFGPQFGRLQGELPHNLNSHDGGGSSGHVAATGVSEAELEKMDKAALIAHILSHKL
eukprot:COSAG06_NODE_759_length_12508_cov_9.809171_15_plen_155_part_00